MTIKVRLFATLRAGRGKEVWLDVSDKAIVWDVIEALDIPESEVSILLINGRDALPDSLLKLGDVVSIFPPVGGG